MLFCCGSQKIVKVDFIFLYNPSCCVIHASYLFLEIKKKINQVCYNKFELPKEINHTRAGFKVLIADKKISSQVLDCNSVTVIDETEMCEVNSKCVSAGKIHSTTTLY